MQNTVSEKQAPLLKVEELTIKLEKKHIIERVSFALLRGQIMTLIGPNGAGKSTLLRAILGLVPIFKGSIQKQANLKVGYMPQSIEISPLMPLTVEGFLTLNHSKKSPQFQALLAELEIQRLYDTPIQHVSGGELQRVLLARSLLPDPDLLILDEPAQGIDINGQSALYGLLTKIRSQQGCGIVLVSHDLHFVMAGTDQVICLNKHICCVGDPKSVSQDPAFLNLFGDQMAQNLAVYSHYHDHHHDLSGHIRKKGHNT